MNDQDFYKNMSSATREKLIIQLKQLNEQAESISGLIEEFKSMAEGRGIAWTDVVSNLCAVPQPLAVTRTGNKVKTEKEVPPEPLSLYVHPDKPDVTWGSKAIVRRVPNWLKELHETTGRPYSAFKV